MHGEYTMEKKLNELLEHIKENTVHLYNQDVSLDTLMQNLVDKGYKFVTNPRDQSVVDLCTISLVLYLRRIK